MGNSSRAGKARRPEMAPPACRRAQLFVPQAHYGDRIQCSAIGENMRRRASTRLVALDVVRIPCCVVSAVCLCALDVLLGCAGCFGSPTNMYARCGRPSASAEFLCLFVWLFVWLFVCLLPGHRRRHCVALQECPNPSAAKSHFFEELGCKRNHPLQRWCSMAHSSTELHDSKRRAQPVANASDMRHTTHATAYDGIHRTTCTVHKAYSIRRAEPNSQQSPCGPESNGCEPSESFAFHSIPEEAEAARAAIQPSSSRQMQSRLAQQIDRVRESWLCCRGRPSAHAAAIYRSARLHRFGALCS